MARFILPFPSQRFLCRIRDQFIGKKISEILPAAAANVVFWQSGKQLKKVFGRTSMMEKNNDCVGLNFP
jgi:hypothetical protein